MNAEAHWFEGVLVDACDAIEEGLTTSTAPSTQRA